MPFDLQPTLVGELLRLRPLVAGDFDALFAVASDPLIWEQHPDSDRYKPDVFAEFFRVAMASGGAFAAVEIATGEIVGSSRYFGYSEAESEVEIGWSFLPRRLWGGRYNGEMKRLMLAHALRFVTDVVFLVGPDNRRSRRAMEKIGGELIGTRINTVGKEAVVYRITRAG